MKSVDLVTEVTDQELNGAVGARSGGLFTVPGTSSVGYFCTISYECWGFVCGNG